MRRPSYSSMMVTWVIRGQMFLWGKTIANTELEKWEAHQSLVQQHVEPWSLGILSNFYNSLSSSLEINPAAVELLSTGMTPDSCCNSVTNHVYQRLMKHFGWTPHPCTGGDFHTALQSCSRVMFYSNILNKRPLLKVKLLWIYKKNSKGGGLVSKC